MPKHYTLLIALAVLLAGCNHSERPTERATAAQLPAAAPAPGPVSASPLLPAATQEELAARRELLAPADEAAALPLRARHPATSPAAWHLSRAVPADSARPGKLAATMPLPGGAVAAPADSMALAQADGAELRAYLQTGLPAPGTFLVRPDRDTLLIGPQGTQLLLAANAFALPADSVAVVRVQLHEFYSPADIVLAGLSTMAGPRLLETGGMVRIEATAGNRPVQLRPGAFVHLRLPARSSQPGMQVFKGVAHAPGRGLDWQEPGLLQADSELPAAGRSLRARRQGLGWKRRGRRRGTYSKPALAENQLPEYPHGERAFRRDLTAAIDYSDALRARLRRGHRISRSERQALTYVTKKYGERVLQLVDGTLTLDSTGTRLRLEPRRPADADALASVRAALAQLPPWQPASYHWYVVPSLPPASPADPPGQVVRLPLWLAASRPPASLPGPVGRHAALCFTESGRVRLELDDWQLGAASERRRLRCNQQITTLLTTRQLRNDSLYAANRPYYDSLFAARRRVVDSLNAAGQRRATAELARLRTQFTDTSTTAITQAGVYNELSSQGLQWINCDRYLGPGPLITFGVDAGRPGAVVTLLFKGFRSVMSGELRNSTKTVFHNVPLGRSATVVAIRRENGVTYLATRATLIGPLVPGGLSYRPVTMGELRAELAALH